MTDRENSVRVSPGEHVTAGQTLATLDKNSLRAAVAAARATLAQARQTLADDEAAQASDVRLTSARSTPSAAPSAPTGSASQDASTAVRRAQQAVVAAQRAFDAAISAQDAAIHDRTTGLAAQCATAQDSITSTVAADTDGVISGSVGAHPSLVTLDDGATGAT